jgi:hypothetical protein
MKRRKSRAGGFAMIEVAIAVMVLLIAIGGTVGFNEYSVTDVYRSRATADASMLGTMIMQAWKGQGGIYSFDPVTGLSPAILDCDDVTLGYAWVGPSIPENFTLCWYNYPYFRIKTNDVVYRVALSYRYVDGKKYLNVTVGWPSSLEHTFWESSSRIGVTESVN